MASITGSLNFVVSFAIAWSTHLVDSVRMISIPRHEIEEDNCVPFFNVKVHES